jgi:hypothetical protein
LRSELTKVAEVWRIGIDDVIGIRLQRAADLQAADVREVDVRAR